MASTNDFVQLDFNLDANSIADDAIERLRGQWDGWEPEDTDPEVIQIEALAPLAANVATIASNMPPGALIAFGEKCLGIPRDEGTPATTTVTINVIASTADQTISAGGEIQIDGSIFALTSDALITAGLTSVSGVEVAAEESSSDSNGLVGLLAASLSLPPFVTDVSVETPTHGGTDPETDDEYVSKISAEQQLRARTLVTPRDFEVEAVTQFQNIGRAHAAGNTARLVTITIADVSGEPVDSDTKLDLALDYAFYRAGNTTFNIQDATYTFVTVVWQAVLHPGFDKAAAVDRIDGLLSTYLSPTGYGSPNTASPATLWYNDPVIRLNSIIGLIERDDAVAYVPVGSVTLNGVAADFTMPGDVALPRSGAHVGTVS